MLYLKMIMANAMKGRSSAVKLQERDAHRVEGVLASVRAKVAPERLA
jgi:hypothetical protein